MPEVGAEPESSARWSMLDAAWDDVRAPWADRGEPFAVLFSGGVDSAFLAWELRTAPGLRLFTIGEPASHDLAAGREIGALLGLPWTGHDLDEGEVRGVDREMEDLLGDLRPIDRDVQLSLVLATRHAPPGPILCGQGVDELFGGYARYEGLTHEEAARMSAQDVARLIGTDWPRTLRLAEREGRTLAAPYLDSGFLSTVQQIPSDLRFPAGPRKAAFRSWARHRGLPESVVSRPKRAMQYGSGVERLRRRGRRTT